MTRKVENGIWLAGKTEKTLAGYQGSQGRSNNCGELAVGAAVNLLFKTNLAGQEIVNLANKGWLSKGLRAWPGGPTSPRQQVRLAREICRIHGLSAAVEHRRASRSDLLQWLRNPSLACLVTIAWDNRRPPEFKARDGWVPRPQKSPFFWSGHTMLLAAYREMMGNDQTSQADWGFVNSWAEPGGTEKLFWMAEEEFHRCFEYWLFPIGSRNVVLLDRLANRPGSISLTAD